MSAPRQRRQTAAQRALAGGIPPNIIAVASPCDQNKPKRRYGVPGPWIRLAIQAYKNGEGRDKTAGERMAHVMKAWSQKSHEEKLKEWQEAVKIDPKAGLKRIGRRKGETIPCRTPRKCLLWTEQIMKDACGNDYNEAVWKRIDQLQKDGVCVGKKTIESIGGGSRNCLTQKLQKMLSDRQKQMRKAKRCPPRKCITVCPPIRTCPKTPRKPRRRRTCPPVMVPPPPAIVCQGGVCERKNDYKVIF